MFILNEQDRDYQLEAVKKIKERFKTSDNALLVMTMGLGKSRTCMMLVKDMMPLRVLFVVNTITLLEQMRDNFLKFFDEKDVGCFSGKGKDLSKQITVGTVQSLNRIGEMPKFDLIVLDETHNVSTEDDSQYKKLLISCKESNEDIKILGMSATPFRSSGLIYGNKDSLYDGITFEKNIKWALAAGFLVPPRLKRVNEQFDTSELNIVRGDFDQKQLEVLSGDLQKIEAQVKDALPRLEGRKKIVWSCVSIKHAEDVAQCLRDNGEDAVAFHSKTEDRDNVMQRWKDEGKHLTFISIIKEGFDHSAIDAVVLDCPTRSPVKYLQVVGRGLRLNEGKEDCLVLDYGSVVENCGPIDDPRIPKKGDRNTKVVNMKFCPDCLEYVHINVKQCPSCDHTFVRAEVDRTKNLVNRHRHGFNILSDERVEESWVDIRTVTIAHKMTKTNKKCTTITYYPLNMLQRPFVEYCVWETPYTRMKASEKLSRVGISARRQEEVGNQRPRIPKKIKVAFSKYPEVKEVSFD